MVSSTETEVWHPEKRSASLGARLAIIGLAIVGLLVYLGFWRDQRLKRYAQEQGDWYAAQLADRVGETGVLPLNLEVDLTPERKARMFAMQWLSRDDTQRLRAHPDRVLAGHSSLIPRVLAGDGRIVVFFHNRGFHADWSPEAEFQRLLETQQALLGSGNPLAPDSP